MEKSHVLFTYKPANELVTFQIRKHFMKILYLLLNN